MKQIFVGLVFLIFSVPFTTQAQRTCTSYILNPTVSGGIYSFDIYSKSTNAGLVVRVGTSNFYFDVDQTGGFNFVTVPSLTNVNTNYTGDGGGTADYGPMTVQWVNLGGINKVAVTINYIGNVSLGGTLSTTAPNGELMCTVHLTIANASKTASLAWDPANSSITTSNSQPMTNSYSGSDNSVLPVELTSFTAFANRLTAQLSWATATETNNHGFDVERRLIGSNAAEWTKVGFVSGSGTKSSSTEYSYADNDVTPGRYSYRIKQIDNDGTFKYASSAEVEIGLAPRELALAPNYPNPFNPTTTIEFTVPQDGHASLTIYNSLGQLVATVFDREAQAGYIQKATFDASRLSSGVYFMRLQYNDKNLMKKIVLMK